ncbi:MAG: 50S ribosomal protein L10 [Chlamydiae bacterium]|nr:50S ribosomal protein L10 [Chlamydiota bacterium]
MRAEKQFLLDEIKEKIENSDTFVITSYEKFTPIMSWSLGSVLAKSGSEFEVVKKRVLIKALEKCGLTFKIDEFPGHIGVVFVKGDPAASIKLVFNFCKENEEIFKVIAGKFEGSKYNAKDLEAISKLPSLNEMRAQFLSTLEAPMSQTLAVMESIMTSIMHCLENKIKKDEN